jgi:hypothetical protein
MEGQRYLDPARTRDVDAPERASDAFLPDLSSPTNSTSACDARSGLAMVVLNFTLTPEAASKVHDLLACLGKFSDTVAIEAKRERVGQRHFSYQASIISCSLS